MMMLHSSFNKEKLCKRCCCVRFILLMLFGKCMWRTEETLMTDFYIKISDAQKDLDL